MTRITSLLVAFILTGSPVMNAACLGWCGSHQAVFGHCHDNAARTGITVMSGHDTCTALPAGSPFLKIDPVSPQVATPALAGHVPPLPFARLQPRAAQWLTLAAAPSPPLVLRL